MLDRLRDAAQETVSGAESEYARALYVSPALAPNAARRFAKYDANISAVSRRLGVGVDHGRTWKPYQYLALLFTEHYLDRYFRDPEALRDGLEEARRQSTLGAKLTPYSLEDLRTVAFQSATGSGKTLILHANILQYRRCLEQTGGRLNNVVLVTPNERLSEQHARELAASGMRGRIFSSEAPPALFGSVEIIDLNKLAERKGTKRVAVRDFGDNNLVLVDEGHLGASGRVWRERRRELSSGGFTFEYSATFNQIAARDRNIRDAYAKCLLFDYAYRNFHAEGYGKDYAITNLPRGMEDANSNSYLLGCLLTFYQQCRIWRDNAARWSSFNLSPPLWVMLGRTVKGQSNVARQGRSDVVRIIEFIAWVLAQEDDVRRTADVLLQGRSGLTDETGEDYFVGRFAYLARKPVKDLHADLCDLLFHGRGRLQVSYVTSGEGELHLRSGSGKPFGVVNVGDSAGLYKLLQKSEASDLELTREAGFVSRLFPGVDQADSPVNIAIGARRFIAGWSSWRVSVMTLMHVGVGEGPEIIQMFGRGVRLKGWNMSLKRHRYTGADAPVDSQDLAQLETLHIFGLRANYMRAFRDLLEREGVSSAREEIELPVTWNFARKTDLKVVRLPDDTKYETSTERIALPLPGEPGSLPIVRLDLHSRLQSVEATGHLAEPSEGSRRNRIAPRHVALFDRARLHDRLLERKRRRGWHNLTIGRGAFDRLLDTDDWYELRVPLERLEVAGFDDVRTLEDIALELTTAYVEAFWRRCRRRWEQRRLEVGVLTDKDPNRVEVHRLSVDSADQLLVKNLQELSDDLSDGYRHGLRLGVLRSRIHAYKPLLYADSDSRVTVQPVPLNRTEKQVVEGLGELAEASGGLLAGRELFLIRNLTRGRGISFFDDYAYYPDFILWLKAGARQDVVFLDPKGLSRFGPRERHKVALHREIKEVEARLRSQDPDLFLHAYVLSTTSLAEVGADPRPAAEWEKDGVYFLSEERPLERIVADVLACQAAP